MSCVHASPRAHAVHESGKRSRGTMSDISASRSGRLLGAAAAAIVLVSPAAADPMNPSRESVFYRRPRLIARELAPLGISVTIVEPGAFLTNFAGRSLTQSATAIDTTTPTPPGSGAKNTTRCTGTQAGDPVKAATAIIARRRRIRQATRLSPARLRRSGTSLSGRRRARS